MADFFNDADYADKQRRFYDFFDAPLMPYRAKLSNLYKDNKYSVLEERVTVDINDLRQYNRALCQSLLDDPLHWFPPMESALNEFVKRAIIMNEHISIEGIKIALDGSFGSLHTNPRYLSSKLLGKIVCLDGIITSCSLVRPKLLKSVHYSQKSKIFLAKNYFDTTMLVPSNQATGSAYPTEAGPGDILQSEFGLSDFRDYQTISMQEMPERAPAGQLPRAVDIVLDGDLVDLAKPGDRVRVVGVYRALTGTGQSGNVPGAFRAAILANNIIHLTFNSNNGPDNVIKDEVLSEIRNIARRQDFFELLSRSVAPSIYGHSWIKKAVLLMLLGGTEKNLANGTHIRGDVNILLVGDPSTAKSQVLRFVLGLAPLAIATTGRGSSGVGLTAAVTSDRETSERRLEAGAMVLADRGIVCIDEFDKMSDIDRVAIHEVMEQQTVTIAKAGIHTSLNARCSVLAAANPILGEYKETSTAQENIGLPDSLLSRFDLVFIVLDHKNPENDKRISEHVLKMHRWLPLGLNEGDPIQEKIVDEVDEQVENDKNENIFIRRYAQYSEDAEKENQIGKGGERERGEEGEGEEGFANDLLEELVSVSFLRKYIMYAKEKVQPVLTKTASEQIITAYTEFRQKRQSEEEKRESKTFPVTPRTLETLIRLATAHAKARLSGRVERRDALIAQEMIEYCLYKELKKKDKKKRQKQVTVSEDEHDDPNNQNENDMENKENLEPMMQRLSLSPSPSKDNFNPLHPLRQHQQADKEPVPHADSSISLSPEQIQRMSLNWQDHVRKCIDTIRNNINFKGILTIEELRASMNPEICSHVTTQMLNELLEEMQSLNHIMYRDGIIYIV